MKAMLNGKADNVFEKKEKSKNKTSDEDPSERFLYLLLYLFIVTEGFANWTLFVKNISFWWAQKFSKIVSAYQNAYNFWQK